MLRLSTVFYHGKSFNLVTFGLYAAFGSVFGYSLAFFYLLSKGIPVTEYIWIALPFFVFGNLVSAKLFSIFSMGRKDYFNGFWNHMNETSFYHQGGVIGFIIAVLYVSFILKIPFFLLSDAVGFGGLATMFIGRIGCFDYGCCVGKPTLSRFHIAYTNPEAKICREVPELIGIPLVPVQLIASGFNLLLLFLTFILIIFFPFTGLITIVFFVGINLKRIFIQPLRWKDKSNKISYQWVAFALIVTIVVLISWFTSSGEELFRKEETVIPFTISNYFTFIIQDYRILIPLLLAGLINFVAYGIHGKKLGTHFNLK